MEKLVLGKKKQAKKGLVRLYLSKRRGENIVAQSKFDDWERVSGG